jgi:serine/threonine protein kinase
MRKLNDDPFSHEEVRHIIFQIATSLEYIHSHGFFHRDVKPENILIWKKTTVKLGDFGLVKEIRHPTPFTEYVATRWYRAPENVLGSRSYNYPVDIFALGCIMAELYTFKPLFPGTSEMDQFDKISRILGRPDPADWPDAKRLADRKLFTMPEHPRLNLRQVVPRASSEALKLMDWMLSYNPRNRPKPNQVLSHAFFHPKTLAAENKLSMGTSKVLTSQDTTAESKTRPGMIESLVIGQNKLQINNRILKNASHLAGGSNPGQKPLDQISIATD